MPMTVWIVRWGGFDEECAGRQDAMDRWGQLDARGIEAEVVRVTGEGVAASRSDFTADRWCMLARATS